MPHRIDPVRASLALARVPDDSLVTYLPPQHTVRRADRAVEHVKHVAGRDRADDAACHRGRADIVRHAGRNQSLPTLCQSRRRTASGGAAWWWRWWQTCRSAKMIPGGEWPRRVHVGGRLQEL